MSGKSVMPGRGRKPKPNNQKKLSGSRHTNKDAIEFDLITNVDPPEWLGDLGRGIWETVCPHLCKKKVLAVTDLHNLEAFCSAYETFREAEVLLKPDPDKPLSTGLTIPGANGGYTKNPAATVKNEALRQMTMFGAALGLDPAARGRLLGGGGGSGGNEFEGF